MITKTQLAEIYGISRPTLNKRLKEIGMYEKGRSLSSPQEVVKIFEILGKPIDIRVNARNFLYCFQCI